MDDTYVGTQPRPSLARGSAAACPLRWLLLAGAILGGAIPWLEAVVVIPAGILDGLHPVPAVIAGVSGMSIAGIGS